MCKKNMFLFAALISIMMLWGCCFCSKENNITPEINKETQDSTIAVWNVKEITFKSSKLYDRIPIYNVSLDITFTAPNGITMVMPGFWDGGDIWKVRFAPTMTGVWTYKTSCSDSTNFGLNNLDGKIICNEYKGELPIYKHGFLKNSPNSRFFTYNDGTPFFYLGDTHWSLPFERFEGSNIKNIDSQFKYIVNKRIEQGFNVYQSEPIQTKNKYGDQIYSLHEFTYKTLGGFLNLDRKFKYIADKGLVHANAQLFFSSELANPNRTIFYTKEYLDKLARYWVARYAAYPVLWTTAQEVDATMYDQFDRENNPWKTVINSIYKYDPYKHPSTAHQENTNETTASTSGFKDLESHKWFGVQWSPLKDGPQNFIVPRDYWDNSGSKVVVNYEGHYDHFWTGTFGARMQGWTAYLNGMFGHGYGAAGVWLLINNYNEADYAGNYDLDKDTGTDPETRKEMKRMNWYDGVSLPAALQLGTYMRNFFESFEWWKLEPCFEDKEKKHFDLSSAWYSASSISNKTYVVYFYNPTTVTGNLYGLETHKTYTAKWYNPRTGQYRIITGEIMGTGEKSLWKIPVKPDEKDWVLYVTINKQS